MTPPWPPPTPTTMNSLPKAPNNTGNVWKAVLLPFIFLLFAMPKDTSAQKSSLPKVTLAAEHAVYPMGAEIELTFTISNPNKKKIKYCDYHTPFEGIRNNILLVTHPNGEKVAYAGPMVKRKEPSKENYHKVKGGESVSTKFVINQGYPISDPGKYTIQFMGNASVNMLPNSNVLELELTGK